MSGKWKKGQPEGPCQSSLEQENTNFASITLSVWYTLYYCIKCIYTLYTRTIQYTLYSTQSEKFRQDLLSKSQEYQFCQYNTLCLVIYTILLYTRTVYIYTIYPYYTLYGTQSEKFLQDLLSKSQEYQLCQYCITLSVWCT